MDVSYILDNYQQYEQSLKDRFTDTKQLVEIKQLYTDYIKNLYTEEQLRRFSNKISNANNEISKLNRKSANIQCNDCNEPSVQYDNFFSLVNDFTTEECLQYLNIETYNLLNVPQPNLINVGKKIKILIKANGDQTKLLFDQMKKAVYQLPNLLYNLAPILESEDDNPVLKLHINEKTTSFNLLNQYQLSLKLGILEDATEISGSRGYFLVGDGVRLNYALISYALDFLKKNGYKLMQTPHFINRDKIDMISQLSDYEETLYELQGENKFLIATSEQPLTAYFCEAMKTTVNNCASLPIKLGGISSCYRKEAGKHGIDTLGMFRVHQFEKVEQFCVTNAEDSWAMMESMINVSAEFYESLGLSYRVVNIASKALNNAAAMKYDLEGFFPGSDKFRELVSCTNTTDYFSRRLRTKNSKGELVHMLNCTLCANTRTLCCILETYQTETGINIPPVLQGYLGGQTFIPFC